MKNIRRTAAALLSVAMICVFGVVTPLAQEPDMQENDTNVYFKSIAGTVKEITDYFLPGDVKDPNRKFVLVEDEDGQTVNFVLSEDTYLVDDFEVLQDSSIICFYDATRPAILIYPPQYEAEVIAEYKEDRTIKADRFDENLTSIDNELKLNISSDTQIVLQNGDAFDGELENRKLVVVYDVSTRSIPAQTNPKKVIVLYENMIPPVHEVTDEELAANTDDAEEETVTANEVYPPRAVINGKTIDAECITGEDGSVLLPLRAVLEQLNIDISWNAETKEVVADNNISFKPGENSYMKGGVLIALETNSALINGHTFVPVSFFASIIPADDVSILE